eukprot:m.1318811 g.1318811  ORF g.1318811 m.1318811 type:complete len:394 (+) comp24842_c0_seq5:169-1350(+)
MNKISLPTPQACVIAGGIVRVALMLYGIWHDEAFPGLRYTDIDYDVFSDAATYVAHGESPYRSSTYRYTPLLAMILTPNIWLHTQFGKLVFVVVDIIVGIQISLIVRDSPMAREDESRKDQNVVGERSSPRKYIANDTSNGNSPAAVSLCVLAWMFNPLTMGLSTRGSADSIMAMLVLGTLRALQMQRIVAAGVWFAMAVHFKMYPVIYALPIALYLGSDAMKSGAEAHPISMPRRLLRIATHGKVLKFATTAAVVILGVSYLFYTWYGFEFLWNTHLYHVVRRDHRHNFSPYFYLLYLTFGSDVTGSVGGPMLGLACFLPQVRHLRFPFTRCGCGVVSCLYQDLACNTQFSNKCAILRTPACAVGLPLQSTRVSAWAMTNEIDLRQCMVCAA